jgi:DNA-binding transcriptional regulator YiaG
MSRKMPTPAEFKKLRMRLGWSQAALAKALGVQRNTVARWEMGMHPIPRMAVMLLDTWITHQAGTTPRP